MHELGTRFVTEIHRGGDSGPAETLVEVDPWDFDGQTSYPHEGVVLEPGDAIVTRCTYDNPHDYTVTHGEDTAVYPLDAIPGGERDVCLLF
jgi:hypothetical protein